MDDLTYLGQQNQQVYISVLKAGEKRQKRN